ncbi:vWA domain-containing protein [Clostridium oryzae]|uniref:VWFA domain-containing protein n=1 Tax=Clostridium oryzae TaxID=1450648 RepID=A0A1V4ISR2_9CLOT|nr:VWA domain-containing protein [Clostridium oryzae]OPJ63071.1 hypothetical protein CLORY_14370 [Clostridium oryzae]
MRLLYLNALWFLLLVPLLVLLYILKQRFQEKEVSSLYLWRQAVKDAEASTPFQKLRKNMLFFIQLLILLFLILALCQPFIPYSNNSYQNIIIVIDTSGSMSASMDNSTRIEEAKKRAEDMVRNLAGNSKVTLITAGKNTKVLINNSQSRQQILDTIKAIRCENSKGNINTSYSLVNSIAYQLKEYKVIYFSDRNVDLKDLNAQAINIGLNVSNVSLDYISYSMDNDKLDVMVRVKNHNSREVNQEICIYGEHKAIGLKDVKLRANQLKTVYFSKLPGGSKYIYAQLEKADGLEQDNRIYTVIRQSDTPKILLNTSGNMFIEKAINSIKNVDLYKTANSGAVKGKYDLYIFDNQFPRKLPEEGNIIIVNPSKSVGLFNVSTEYKGGNAIISSNRLTRYMDKTDIAVSKFKAVKTPYWANTLFKIHGEEAGFEGEYKGKKIMVLGFDFHNTNMPLTTNFPIFINNVINDMVKVESEGAKQYSCGDDIKLYPKSDAEHITVVDPGNKTHRINVKYAEENYRSTNKPGIYKIIQSASGKNISRLAAVNFPTSESSLAVGQSKDNIEKVQKVNGVGLNLRNYLIYAVLLLIMVEWFVYKRS